MAHFAISFELRCGSEVTRRRLCDEIERLAGIEAIGGVYLVELDGTAEEIRDYFARFLGTRDRLIVAALGSPPAMRVPLAGAAEWITQRFSVARAE